ncbi:hypothetical protein ACFZBU_39420 [Embleya sp. NPDC008237]|uniref:hypothetical protein n=1 Tax=Embleya sp. NPDC008237 TaxID=3363978 RepID=UPI0036E3F7CB
MDTSVDVGDVPHPADGVRARIEAVVPGSLPRWTELFSSGSGTVWEWCGASVTNVERDVRDLLAEELGETANSIPSHRIAALAGAIRGRLAADRYITLVLHRLASQRGRDRVGVWVCSREEFAFHSIPLAAAWVDYLALAYDGVTMGIDRPLALLGAEPAGSEQGRAAS